MRICPPQIINSNYFRIDFKQSISCNNVTRLQESNIDIGFMREGYRVEMYLNGTFCMCIFLFLLVVDALLLLSGMEIRK
jgi:hypothetical protein